MIFGHNYCNTTSTTGLASPTPTTPDDFDPGAKYHIIGDVPYIRYFFAQILMFMFHKQACVSANHEGPLYRWSKTANKKYSNILQIEYFNNPYPIFIHSQFFRGPLVSPKLNF